MSVRLYFKKNEENEANIIETWGFKYPYPEVLTYVIFASKRRYVDTQENYPDLPSPIATRLCLTSKISEILDQIDQARHLSFMMPGNDTPILTELKGKLGQQASELRELIKPIAEKYPDAFVDCIWCSSSNISSSLEKWNVNTAIQSKDFIEKVVKLRRFVVSTASTVNHPLIKFLTGDPMLYLLAQESEKCFQILDNS